MIRVKSLQLELNKFLLLVIGLWPYTRSKLVRLQFTLFYSISLTFVLFQCATFITAECTSQIITEVLSAVSISIAFIMMYNSFLFNLNVLKQILELIQNTYDGLRDKTEVSIIEKYGNIAKYVTIICTSITICGSPTVLYPFLHDFLDVILPLNQSRPHPPIVILREYFIDQDKYFYFIEIHGIAAFCIEWIAMLATGTMIITYIQYVCGMFKIASYRIEQAIDGNDLKNSRKDKYLRFQKFVLAIDIHRKAMESINILLTKMQVSYFFVAIAGMISASLSLFRIFQGILFGYSYEKMIISFILLSVCYLYMFLANNCGQQIIDHNNQIFITVYNVQWYLRPLHMQKLILFLLQRGTKTFNMKFAGIFVTSLEGFAAMLSASISYFTVLYSTGK